MKRKLALCTCFFGLIFVPVLGFQFLEKPVCQDSLIPQTVPFIVIDGLVKPDTIPEHLFNQFTRPPSADVSVLSSLAGTVPRYLAVGGSLTAGVRNGGLYRFAQLTAYPNLIARQMGLKDFGVPLFSKRSDDGRTYFKVAETEPFPMFQTVGGDSGMPISDIRTRSAYSGSVDNLALPFAGVFALGDRQDWRYTCDLLPSIPYDFQYRHFFRRYLSENSHLQWSANVLDYAVSKKSDLCTIELGIDDFIVYATTGGYHTSSLPFVAINEEGNPLIRLLNGLKDAGTKAIVATVPDIIDFPYFHFITPSKTREYNGGKALYAMISDDLFAKSKGCEQFLNEVRDTDLLLPTKNVAELFSDADVKHGFSPQEPLESKDVLTQDELGALSLNNSLNDLIRNLAVKFKYPIVDLHGIYKRILDGHFITDDGVRIDPSYPNGNFFSDDGLHPTAFGQAVIANEWIKVINKHFGTQVPLLTTSSFLVFQRN